MDLRKLSFIFIVFPVACTSVDELVGNEPIIDTKGVNMALYEADLTECQEYADQVQIARKAAAGAATGAVVGGAIGAILRDSDGAKRGAGVGAVTGAAGGVGSGLNERKRVVRNCLNGRGYRVLN